MIKRLLYADLERQLQLEGRASTRPTLLGICARLLHPRFLPLALHRLSHDFYVRGFRPGAVLCSYANLVLFGLEVPARCDIGAGLFLPHTQGTVIGAARIGINATIYQGVTLGARELDMGFDAALRPTLGDNVTIGAGAKVLGGIVLGDNVKVGANSVVLHSVPGNCTVAGIPAREIGQRRYEG